MRSDSTPHGLLDGFCPSSANPGVLLLWIGITGSLVAFSPLSIDHLQAALLWSVAMAGCAWFSGTQLGVSLGPWAILNPRRSARFPRPADSCCWSPAADRGSLDSGARPQPFPDPGRLLDSCTFTCRHLFPAHPPMPKSTLDFCRRPVGPRPSRHRHSPDSDPFPRAHAGRGVR